MFFQRNKTAVDLEKTGHHTTRTHTGRRREKRNERKVVGEGKRREGIKTSARKANYLAGEAERSPCTTVKKESKKC